MIESDITSWFEEKKEDMVKEYLKKMDCLLMEKSLSPEDMHHAMAKNERLFLTASTALRNKYDTMVAKAREKEKKKEFGKEQKEKHFNQALFLWTRVKEGFALIMHPLIRIWSTSMAWYRFNIRERAERKSQALRFAFADRLHPLSLFYKQHLWPILHFLNTPNRILKKKMLKLKDAIKALAKKGMVKSSALTKKAMKLSSEKMKIATGAIGKLAGKIKGKIKQVIAFCKKLLEFVKAKYLGEHD